MTSKLYATYLLAALSLLAAAPAFAFTASDRAIDRQDERERLSVAAGAAGPSAAAPGLENRTTFNYATGRERTRPAVVNDHFRDRADEFSRSDLH